MSRTQIATDNFDSYSVSSFPTSNWTDLDNWNGQLRCVSSGGGLAIGSGYSAYSMMRRDAGAYSADQYSKVTLAGTIGGNTDQAGIVLRTGTGTAQAGTESGYLVYISDHVQSSSLDVRVERMVNSTRSSPLATQTVAFSVGDTLSAEITGTGATVTIIVYKNDVAISGLDNIQDTDAARIVTAGRPGIMCYGNNGILLDSWEGGDVTSGTNYTLPVDVGQGVGEGQSINLTSSDALVISVVYGPIVGEAQDVFFILTQPYTDAEGVGEGQTITLLAEAIITVTTGEGAGAGQTMIADIAAVLVGAEGVASGNVSLVYSGNVVTEVKSGNYGLYRALKKKYGML